MHGANMKKTQSVSSPPRNTKKIGVTENKVGNGTKRMKACDRKFCKESKERERAVKVRET